MLNKLRKPVGPYRLGTLLCLDALLLQLLVSAAQLYSLADWDGAVDAGVHEDRFTGDDAARARARFDWGVSVADMAWTLPLNVVASIGLLLRWPLGYDAALMMLSIGVYWPFVLAAQRWPQNELLLVVALLLFSCTSLVGIAGLCANRDHLLSPHAAVNHRAHYDTVAMA